MNATYALLNGMTSLPLLGVIRAQGEDAAKFLHGQLTQDFVVLEPGQARLAAFLSAKGRMQASFIGFKRSPSDLVLVCSRDLLAGTLKRLSMFVMRAQCKLTDASAEFQLLGLAGDMVEKVAGAAAIHQQPWTVTAVGGADAVHLYPANGVPRALWFAPSGTPMPDGPALASGLWQWGEVCSGIATLNATLADIFVPQMLNYESVGGVNFKKGCYPGQEVVARSQFRGTLKRRLYLGICTEAAAAGTEIFTSADADQPCGTVVQMAAGNATGASETPSGTAGDGIGYLLQASLQVAAASAGDLRLGSANGPPVQLLPLPYVLQEDI